LETLGTLVSVSRVFSQIHELTHSLSRCIH